MITDKCYDLLCTVQRWLTAAGVLYLAIAAIWGLPYGEQVVGTITAIDAFLGALLGISTAQWKKGGYNER